MGSVREEFTAALEALVEEIKQDRTVLAALLCGSLAHDTVWAGSDIDLVLVTADDRKPGEELEESRALYADGINVHASLIPRGAFRRLVEGSLHNSFLHALLAKGRLLYTHDESLAALCGRLGEVGARDTQVQLLAAATIALPPLYKAHKWFVTRGDLEYTALWILHTATPLARVEVIGRRLIADREVLPQALKLNPRFFTTVYTELLNRKKTSKGVQAALDAIDGYLAERAPALFAPLLEHLRQVGVGEPRSAGELEHHFARTFGIAGVTTACEYLADRGLIGKAGAPVKLTRRSNLEVQELAFFSLGGDGGD
jgi:predicted nucleotidyltransferase